MCIFEGKGEGRGERDRESEGGREFVTGDKRVQEWKERGKKKETLVHNQELNCLVETEV